jgi:hypothetical protein
MKISVSANVSLWPRKKYLSVYFSVILWLIYNLPVRVSQCDSAAKL